MDKCKMDTTYSFLTNQSHANVMELRLAALEAGELWNPGQPFFDWEETIEMYDRLSKVRSN